MINITNLTFAYKKKKNLFTGLHCNLLQGNIYGLLGKNGAGKTTLLNIICGMLFPQKGECNVLDFESKQRHPDFLADMFLIAEELFTPPLTIKEYSTLYAPFYPHFDRNRFRDYLNEFSLSEKEKLTGLSYGQKKQFFISFGLATNSRIFIMDEPTNGLDIPSKSRFRKLLVSTITDDRLYFISTHQVRDMQQLIDPVLILDGGEIIFTQPMEKVNERLSVRLVAEEPGPGESLFYEKVIGGYAVLCNENDGGNSSVDLELLFNAVINNKEEINKIFGAHE